MTHACFDPVLLVQNYPRGKRELLGPFHTFGPRETVAWFEARGVKLKTEKDGRIFPVTDSSQTIIDCLLQEAKRFNVAIRTETKLVKIEKRGSEFLLVTGSGETLHADRLILATGSAPAGFEMARGLGHSIVPPVPSLFTFTIPEFPLVDLAGVSVRARLKLLGLEEVGPLLITHWGFSGPCALRLSAFGARKLAEKSYETNLVVDWLPDDSFESVRASLKRGASLGLPTSLWKKLTARAGVCVPSLSHAAIERLCRILKQDIYGMKGKSANKEEFVTCGGVKLSEVNFKTMESKLCPGLHFCGEILDIDGVTGGFNFQNAWTTGYISGQRNIY